MLTNPSTLAAESGMPMAPPPKKKGRIKQGPIMQMSDGAAHFLGALLCSSDEEVARLRRKLNRALKKTEGFAWADLPQESLVAMLGRPQPLYTAH